MFRWKTIRPFQFKQISVFDARWCPGLTLREGELVLFRRKAMKESDEIPSQVHRTQPAWPTHPLSGRCSIATMTTTVSMLSIKYVTKMMCYSGQLKARGRRNRRQLGLNEYQRCKKQPHVELISAEQQDKTPIVQIALELGSTTPQRIAVVEI